ncbi:hypothetical protein CP8484711_0724B, partial [Chlamydia psittaci 84-8471/1]|jgi:hypothetical protein
VVLC